MNSGEFVKYLSPFSNYSTMCEKLTTRLKSSRGDYGTAFYLNDGRVGKLFKKYDYAYSAFLNMVANSNSVHLPRIYDMGDHKRYAYVILEFLGPCEITRRYKEFNFNQISDGMTRIILGKEPKIDLPISLIELAFEMRVYSKGLCLDFHERNFGFRDEVIVTFDPFAIKTKTNSHLKTVEGKPLYKGSK